MIFQNQYQDKFKLKKNIYILDYLKGTLQKYPLNERVELINDEESKYLDNLYKKYSYRLNPSVLSIALIPTYNCNMKCIYCYEGNLTIMKERMLSSDIDNIIKYIKKIYDEGSFSEINFSLLGGEPITKDNIKWFNDFFIEFKKLNLKFNISCISNGLEIRDNIEYILDMKLSHIQLTLDGLEKTHNYRKKSKIKGLNPYNGVINTVDILLESKIYTSLRMNVDMYNVSEIIKINSLINEKGWNKSKFFDAYLYPVTQSSDSNSKKYISETLLFEKVLNELSKLNTSDNNLSLDFHGVDFVDSLLRKEIFVPKNKFCASCSSQYVFDCKGNIYTCWWGASKSEFIIGNFRKDNFDSEKVKAWHYHDVNSIENCISCKYKYICGTGCVFKSYSREKTLNAGNCSDFYNIIKLYLSYLESEGML